MTDFTRSPAPTPDYGGDLRPRMRVRELEAHGRHGFRAIDPDAWAVCTADRQWALWLRVDREWAVRQSDARDLADAIRIRREAK